MAGCTSYFPRKCCSGWVLIICLSHLLQSVCGVVFERNWATFSLAQYARIWQLSDVHPYFVHLFHPVNYINYQAQLARLDWAYSDHEPNTILQRHNSCKYFRRMCGLPRKLLYLIVDRNYITVVLRSVHWFPMPTRIVLKFFYPI